jgi:hypothetical protein
MGGRPAADESGRAEDTMTNPGDSAAPPAKSGRDRRSHRRHRVLWQAKLYQRGVIHECVVANVSAGGAKVIMEVQLTSGGLDLTHGAMATLTIDRFGDFPGRIVWRESGQAGVEFLQPVEEVFRIIGSQLPL